MYTNASRATWCEGLSAASDKQQQWHPPVVVLVSHTAMVGRAMRVTATPSAATSMAGTEDADEAAREVKDALRRQTWS